MVFVKLGQQDPKMARRLRPLDGLELHRLQIHEIYASIQGEGSHTGLPCTFVRLTGCHLRCRWCDTRKAFGGGVRMDLEEVLARVAQLSPKLVLVTGGEPLLQPACLPLMKALCDRGYTTLLETSGGVSIEACDPRVVRIVDIKAPDSGEVSANVWENFALLRPQDEVKIVLASREDYVWAKEILEQRGIGKKCPVLLSCAFGLLEPRDLVAWVMQDGLDVRVQLQLHKYIWEPKTEGV